MLLINGKPIIHCIIQYLEKYNINNYILNPKKNENFGNWERYIDLIDPFGHILGLEIIGNYIYNFHTWFINKLSVKNNILNSNKIYLENILQKKFPDIGKYIFN